MVCSLQGTLYWCSLCQLIILKMNKINEVSSSPLSSPPLHRSDDDEELEDFEEAATDLASKHDVFFGAVVRRSVASR